METNSDGYRYSKLKVNIKYQNKRRNKNFNEMSEINTIQLISSNLDLIHRIS